MSSKAKGKRDERQRRRALLGMALVAPLVIWLLLTIAYPIFSLIRLSFLDVGIIGTGGDFVGLANYQKVLSSRTFGPSMGRSLVWVLGNGVLQTLLAFIAALVLNLPFRGRVFARTWVILPWIVPTVVAVIVWRWMLGTSGGIVNTILLRLGLIQEQIGFFSTGASAMSSLVALNSWRFFPLLTIIILAGMQGIAQDLYDAAAVDGASAWRRFVHITIPGLKPVLFVMGLVGTLWSVNIFDVIYLVTGGGPSRATMTLPVLIYDMAFLQYRLGRAAAAAVLMALVVTLFTIAFIYFLAPRGEDEDEEWR